MANYNNSFKYWFVLLALITFGGISASQAATVSVTSYGAVADGVTDNLAAFNRAIAAAGAGGTVNFPAGKFAYRGVIRITGVKLIGAGPSSTILYALDYNNEAIFMYGSGSEVRNMQLTGVISPNRLAAWETTHISLFGATNFVIDNVYIEGSAAAGIQTAQSTNNGRITNNTVKNTNADSIHMTDGASFITVENNTIVNSGDDGVAVVSYQSDGKKVHDITARNNKINNRYGRNMSVVGGYNVLYENNYLDGNPNYACMYLAQESSYTTYGDDNIVVQYNTMKNCGSSTTGHADVMIFSDGAYPINGVKLIRNDIYARYAGVRVYGDVRSLVLDNNRVTGGIDYIINSSGVSLTKYSSGAVGYVDPGTSPTPSPSPTPTSSYSYAITVTSPASGATVSGTIQVKGTAPGMLNLEIFDSASNLLAQVSPDAAGNFSASVDTTKLANGVQSLRIDAWDAAAGQAFSHSDEKLLSLNVQNSVPAPASDTQAPSVSITSPASGASFNRKSIVSVSANASDDVGVVDVQFYLNGALICTDSTAAYSCSMRMPNQRRTNTIEVRARDAAGNVGRQSITVNTK